MNRGGSNGKKTAPETAEAKVRAAKALEMRLEGRTFDEIAESLGYSGRSGAHAAVTASLKAIIREPAEALLKLNLERLDKMFTVAYLNAQAGDVNAIAACMRIMERQARLLGLDAPERKEVTGKGGRPLLPSSKHEMTDAELAAIAAGGGATAA